MKSAFLVFALALQFSGCATHPTVDSKTATPVVSPHDVPAWATPHYLNQLPFALEDVIAPPPPEGTEVDKKDLADLVELEKTRTSAQCDAAREQEVPTLQNSFVYTPEKKDLPKLAKLSAKAREDLQALFAHTERDVGFVSHAAKLKWSRPRPYLRSKDLHPCIKRESSYAYPSGHAAFGSAGALLLTEIFPRYAPAFKKAAEQVGRNRMIGGVHHETDIEAGYVIGRKTYESLRKDPQFVTDLEAVKNEVATEHFR